MRTAAPALLWGSTTSLRPRDALAVVGPARAVGRARLALLAAARPQRGAENSRGVDIVLAIDISPSMRAGDMGSMSDRLAVARATARDFIRSRPHDRIGLVGFAATAFTQCPLTLDHETLQELLGQLDFGLAEDGTAIGMGLATSVQRLSESKTPSKVAVLLTDGENNRGAIDRTRPRNRQRHAGLHPSSGGPRSHLWR